MFVVSLTAPRVIEFRDVNAFAARTQSWLHQREGENTYLIGKLRGLDPRDNSITRIFTIEQENTVIAAGLVAPNGCLYLTWTTPEAVKSLLDHAAARRWPVNAVCAPVHIARDIAALLAERSGLDHALIRAERVYQMTRVTCTPPSSGRLEVACPADKPFVKRWFEAFVEESEFYGEVARDPRAVDWLIDPRLLYLWKSPGPVAMASWVAPTMHAGAINYVYVPPEHRGRGHAKAVTAALAQQMLASGLRYCFILSDADDARLNHLYQCIGAHAIGDLAYFTISPKPQTPRKTRSGDSHCPAGCAT